MYPHAIMHAAMTLCLAAAPAPHDYPAVTLRAAYGHALRGDGAGSPTVLRGRSIIDFSPRSFCSVGHRYDPGTGEHLSTGSLAIRDAAEWFSIIAGHYHVHAGTGLIAGRRDMVRVDRIRTEKPTDGVPFTPSRSPGTADPNQGLAVSFSGSRNDLSLSIHGFFSYRDRYVGGPLLISRPLKTTLESISRTRRPSRQVNEPVTRNDYGIILALSYRDTLSLNCIALYTDLNKSGGSSVSWGNGETLRWQHSQRAYRGAAFFCRYHDAVIDLYCEVALSMPREASRLIKKQNRPGLATMTGLILRHPVFMLTIQGKTAQSGFEAPQGATRSAADRFWLGGMSVMPHKHLTLGLTAQESTPPPRYDRPRDPILTRRERLFLRWRRARDRSIILSLSGDQIIADERTVFVTRGAANLSWRLTPVCFISSRGHVQYAGHRNPSWAAEGAFRWYPIKIISISANYGYVHARRDNQIPVRSLTQRNRHISPRYDHRSTHHAGASLTISGTTASLALSYQWRQRGDGSQHFLSVEGILRL